MSALIGSKKIQDYVRRTKKSAFLLFILCSMMVSSVFLLVFSNINNISNDLEKGNSLIYLKSYC